MRYLKTKAVVARALVLAAVAILKVDAGNITLMSYNIRHCRGRDGKVDIQRTADAIRREAPDFAGLNEVDSCVRRSGGVDEPVELGRRLGLHATFAEAIPYQGGCYGNAVLSREKPIAVERIPLPGREPRVLLLCEFTNFWFGTAHLSWRRDGIDSARIIQRIVAEKSGSKPVFLTGDWNANPGSEVLCAMKRFMTLVSSERGRTFTAFKEHAPDSEDVADYIAVDSAHAVSVKVKETHATPDAVTSDHNPVVATVSIEPPPCTADGCKATGAGKKLALVLAPPLRLATYNIHHGEGKDGKYDIRRILDYVESARLDVFGLNEVDCKSKRVNGADTPAEIARLTGLHVEYAAARTYGGGSYGNAVVSKERPLSTERIDLPRGNGERGLKCSLLLCEFKDFWFGSTHFEVRSALTNQLRSVEILRKVVLEKAKTKPVFLSGDWNNEPDSITLTRMREFMKVLNDPKMRTYSGFRVKPKDDEYCIDYIAVDNAHADKYIVRERRVKDWSFDSDHNPVFVTVSETRR